MANRTVSLNQVEPGTTFMVRGNLTFSRITSRIEGEELTRRIDSARRNGIIPIDKPHTTASINHARVVYTNVDQNGNPVSKTLIEQYAEESLYQSSKNPQQGLHYNAYNKGTNLPNVGVLAEDGKTVNGVIPEHELANGLDVTLVMRVFKPKTQMNHGVCLEGVIVNEPIRYYDGNAMANSLSEHGITWNPAPAPANQPANQPVQNPYQSSNTAPQTSQDEPFGQPVKPPVGNPYSTSAPAPAQTAPEQNFETFSPSQQPAPAPAPAPANQPEPNQGGIRYNANDRQY